MSTVTISEIALVFLLTNLLSFFVGYLVRKRKCKIEMRELSEKLRADFIEEYDNDGGW